MERGPLMWMMPLHLHVNQKSDYILYMCWYGLCEIELSDMSKNSGYDDLMCKKTADQGATEV